ncbi:MAG: isochorismate synthase [Myxococcaceae bacterium]|nr:isochorismate synthase [Myxococcaceae bacterium]
MSGPARQIRWFAAARELSSEEVPVAPGPPAFVWRRPNEGLHVTAFGEVAIVEGDPHRDPLGLCEVGASAVQWQTPRPAVPGLWWGGFAFDAAAPRDAAWRPFGAARWILPALSFVEQRDRRWLLATGASPEDPLRRLEVAVQRCSGSEAPAGSPLPTVREVEESRDRWTGLVDQANAAFAAGGLSKVVAARPIDVALDGKVEAIALTKSLAAMHAGCSTFAVAVGNALFAGATPETLVRIERGEVAIDALAGTVPPGTSPGDKELREHRFVVDAIVDALRPLTQHLEVAPEPALIPLRNLVHLHTPVRARLDPTVGLHALVAALHPTPAVCGTPRDAACSWIREHEGFDRGWYAGAVGWVDESDAHLCVALRSALFDDRRARLFVGAGLVPGSTAAGEWDETTRKASAVLDALGGRP